MIYIYNTYLEDQISTSIQVTTHHGKKAPPWRLRRVVRPSPDPGATGSPGKCQWKNCGFHGKIMGNPWKFPINHRKIWENIGKS